MSRNRKGKRSTPFSEPREHHYDFAHHALRWAYRQYPKDFFSVVGSPSQAKFEAWLWRETEERIGRPMADIDPSELEITIRTVRGCPAIIVKMPTPIAVTEAYFVGILPTESQECAEVPEEIAFRYFTLEYGSNLDGTSRTVLCEWVGENHINFGDGPAPTLEAFTKALAGRI